MRGFPGQISRMTYGIPGIVWSIAPYYIKAFFTVKSQLSSIFTLEAR